MPKDRKANLFEVFTDRAQAAGTRVYEEPLVPRARHARPGWTVPGLEAGPDRPARRTGTVAPATRRALRTPVAGPRIPRPRRSIVESTAVSDSIRLTTTPGRPEPDAVPLDLFPPVPQPRSAPSTGPVQPHHVVDVDRMTVVDVDDVPEYDLPQEPQRYVVPDHLARQLIDLSIPAGRGRHRADDAADLAGVR